MKHRFNYDWSMKSDYPNHKNGMSVFSCFAGAGGSTMGYKLAGYDVVGAVEIDERMARVYKENHNPNRLFVKDIREFNDFDAQSFHGVDILD